MKPRQNCMGFCDFSQSLFEFVHVTIERESPIYAAIYAQNLVVAWVPVWGCLAVTGQQRWSGWSCVAAAKWSHGRRGLEGMEVFYLRLTLLHEASGHRGNTVSFSVDRDAASVVSLWQPKPLTTDSWTRAYFTVAHIQQPRFVAMFLFVTQKYNIKTGHSVSWMVSHRT